jgi:hypothetical protein
VADQKQVEQLLRDGIGAAKGGNKSEAERMLREVVALDEANEKGWLWLAAVIEDENERRKCLSNVLHINPQNQNARNELELIDRRDAERTGKKPRGSVGGVGQGLIVGLGAVIGLVLMLFIVMVVLFSNQGSATPLPTAADIVAVTQPQVIPATVTGVDLATVPPTLPVTIDPNVTVPAVAVAATLPPTPLPPTPIPPTLPPPTRQPLPASWTPRPRATSDILPTGTTLPTIDLPGRLLAISGTLLSLEGYLPIVTLKPNGADFKQVVDETNRGDFAVLTPDGRVFYMLFSSGTESRLLRYVNFNGSQGRLVQDAWGGQPSIFFQRMPTISGDGRYLAFAGKNVLGNERYSAVYVLDLTRFLNLTPLPTRTQGATPTRTLTATQKPDITPPPTETKSPPGTATATASAIPLNASLMRVTPKDIGENDWPAISPDGRFVVFVTDAAAVGKSGTDLYISSVEPDAPSRQLTTDGDALFESAPEFSPDGKQIAFNVTIEKAPEKQRNAIVIMNVDGSGRQTLVQTENDNNIRPQWSPDGKYIAFSSNRTGKMEIFIIEIATKKLYQVTSLRDPVIITDWGN